MSGKKFESKEEALAAYDLKISEVFREMRAEVTMIRRPLTEITLKLDDLQEYEALRKEQTNNSSLAEMQDDSPKPLAATKASIDELHSRIGYTKKKPSGPSTV